LSGKDNAAPFAFNLFNTIPFAKPEGSAEYGKIVEPQPAKQPAD
jgi:hypothetical protein